ncbi:MAG: hypothetical protein COB53_12525 [Elusimicrobia bacterium]|nr:MAG: hypothetical protein COB53_12525 [Elusimicrobiota bacterium]
MQSARRWLLCIGLLAAAVPVTAEDICSLPPLSEEGKQVVGMSFPTVALAQVREVPREMLLGWLAENAKNGDSSVAFFSDDRWRSSCWAYFSAQSLAEADSFYVLALIPAIRGVTKKGKPFAMRALLSGFGEHRIHYDFEGKIKFKHPDLDNDTYILESRVTLRTPRKGYLEFDGTTYTHWLAGDYPIHSIEGDGKILKVNAGSIVRKNKETPVEPRRPT